MTFPGHVMLYLGMKGDTPYVLSAVGSFVPETGEELTVLGTNTVVINTLNVRRRSGLTWLQCLEYATLPMPE